MAEVPVPKGCHLLGGQIVIKQPNKQIKKKKEFMVRSSMKERTQGP